ncbi:unnamed protein product [Amaranthus hypochondriacus]
MGRPHKNTQNSSTKGKQGVVQVSSNNLSAKNGGNMQPTDEVSSSTFKSVSMADMQEEVVRLKSFVE